MTRKARNFIGGAWSEGELSKTAPVINPTSGVAFGEVTLGTCADVDRATKAAAKAFETWGKLSGSDRAKYMRRMVQVINERFESLVKSQLENSGKPRTEAEADIDGSAATIAYYADMAEALDKRQNSPVDYSLLGYESITHFEPIGVIGMILPWNFPMKIGSWKLGPALAAGCTVIIKPAEATPFADTAWGEIAQAAGLPDGVINIVNGEGPVVGDAMCRHTGIRKISFTGSTPTGIGIMKTVADDVKNISLELGGKSPIIVFDDADIDLAVRLVAEGIFYNCGQCCNATGRLLVQRSIKDSLLTRLKDYAENIVIGGPDNPDATMGPLTTQGQYLKVLAYMDAAKQEGLDLVTGGGEAKDFDQGFFVTPTIYTDVPRSSLLWNEEIFGPVLCVREFQTEEEAIEAGNDTEFGLAATVVTEDEEKAARVAEGLEAGHVYTNVSVAIPPATSWGGFKHSGIGRELGPWGLAGFQEIKTITRRAVRKPK
jgi:betaine-aldehyde dehydrogenase